MYRLTFALGSFRGREDEFLSAIHLRCALECLVQINEATLRYYPHIPNLYDSGVRYHLESDEEDDDWCDVLKTRDHGFGDCEDLVCWYVAECRVRKGLPARADFQRFFSDERVPGRGMVTMDRIHIFARIDPCPLYPRGMIVDVSKDFGMGSAQPTNRAVARAANWSNAMVLGR